MEEKDRNHTESKKEEAKRHSLSRPSHRTAGTLLALFAILLPLVGFIISHTADPGLTYPAPQFLPAGIGYFIPCAFLLILSAYVFFSDDGKFLKQRPLAVILAVIISFTCIIPWTEVCRNIASKHYMKWYKTTSTYASWYENRSRENYEEAYRSFSENHNITESYLLSNGDSEINLLLDENGGVYVYAKIKGLDYNNAVTYTHTDLSAYRSTYDPSGGKISPKQDIDDSFVYPTQIGSADGVTVTLWQYHSHLSGNDVNSPEHPKSMAILEIWRPGKEPLYGYLLYGGKNIFIKYYAEG